MDRGAGPVVTGWPAALLAIAVLPFTLLFGIFVRPFLPRDWHKANRNAAEVAGYIRDFLNETGGEWDWDDFTSVSLKDDRLENIRLAAEMVPLPLDEKGREKLRDLYEQARKLAAIWK